MKSEEWKTYRTRFLVQAKQLSSTLTFVDHLGRQHCGRKGDYLVESSDGVLSIAPRRIFEDIYVPMSAAEADNRRNSHWRDHNPRTKTQPADSSRSKLKRSSFPDRRQHASKATEAATLHNNLLRTRTRRPGPRSRPQTSPTLSRPPWLTYSVWA